MPPALRFAHSQALCTGEFYNGEFATRCLVCCRHLWFSSTHPQGYPRGLSQPVGRRAKKMLCAQLLYITHSAVCTCKHSCHSSAHHPQRQGQGCPGGLAASISWPLRLLPAPQHWRQLSQPSSHRSCHLHLPAQQLLHHQCCGGRQCCHLPHPPASSSDRP